MREAMEDTTEANSGDEGEDEVVSEEEDLEVEDDVVASK